METYSRIGLLKCHGNLQSYWWITSDLRVWGWGSDWFSATAMTLPALNLQWYWTTETSLKLTVVLDYWNVMETYSRIGLLKCHGNLQSYWTTEMSWKLTVVLDYCNAMKTYGRIVLLECHGNLRSYWTTGMPWKLTVILDYWNAMETYSRIGLLKCHGNLQSYWITSVLRGWDWGSDWSSAMAITLLWLDWILQSYRTTEMSWKLTVVLKCCNTMETYSRIGLLQCHRNLQSYWTTAMP
jgi:hypothetical protein